MKTFNHNFKTAFGVIDVQSLSGFQKCLDEVYKYIAKETEFNPAKRYIDAVPLLDCISQTNAELMQLLNEERESIKEELNNITLNQDC